MSSLLLLPTCEPRHIKWWLVSHFWLFLCRMRQWETEEVVGQWMQSVRIIGGGLIQHYKCVPSPGSSEISMFFLTFLWALHVSFYLFLLFLFSPLHFTHFHSCLRVFIVSFPWVLASHRILPPSAGTMQSQTASDTCSRGCQDTPRKAKQTSWALIHHTTPQRPALDSYTIHPFHLSLWQKQQTNEKPCLKEFMHLI